jgi:hypothetical protein
VTERYSRKLTIPQVSSIVKRQRLRNPPRSLRAQLNDSLDRAGGFALVPGLSGGRSRGFARPRKDFMASRKDFIAVNATRPWALP